MFLGMKNSLFRRYISIFVITLALCTAMLGVAFLYFSAQNYSEEKRETLKNAAERARTIVGETVVKLDDSYIVSSDLLDSFKTINESSGATVFLTDPAGTVLVCSEGKNCTHAGPLAQKILEYAIKRGSYSSAGYLDGFLKRGHGQYQYCVPVSNATNLVGFVFAVTPITPLFNFLGGLTISFLAAAGVMMLGATLIVYYATKSLTNPLREMSAAAKNFGSGDFTARVKVEGNDEMANLAGAFNRMAESLSELEKTRRSFIANVSHELRTPMTTIGGYIDGILDGTIPRNREEHYLTIVSDEVKRLSRLTSSLLDITRLEEGQTKAAIVSCNAWDTILTVMWNAERRINEKGIEVASLDVKPSYVLCDADMLYQVIYNLIDNAIKFTPKDGVLSVKVEPSGLNTIISIRNSGQGVPPEELSHIFERFYKTDKSRGLDKTGTGLGLYIVKTLVNKMGGTIAAESELNEYTEFRLTFPTGQEDKTKPKKQIPIFETVKPKPEPESVKVAAYKRSWIGKISNPFRKTK